MPPLFISQTGEKIELCNKAPLKCNGSTGEHDKVIRLIAKRNNADRNTSPSHEDIV